MKSGIALVFGLTITLGCGTGTFRDEQALLDQYHPSGKDAIRGMVADITDINKKSPESFSLDFNIDSTAGVKKYKVFGSAQFNRKQRMMYVSFLDFIFRSPVTTLMQEGDVIRIYYPVEKKMYVDNTRTIDLANYGGVAIDFKLFHDLITGIVPLIQGYTVKQGLEANNGKGSMLILENPRYYETISFQGSEPDKILLINKNTRERFEIYIKKPVTQSNSRIYSEIMIFAQNISLRLTISFKKIQLNAPVAVKTFKDMKLPDNLKVIQM